MPTYVVIWNWTDQGAKTAKESTQRFESASAQMQQLGVTIKDTYWTMGSFDGLTILEAPDDGTASRAMLAIAARGNIRTTTTRAYTQSEISKILDSLP